MIFFQSPPPSPAGWLDPPPAGPLGGEQAIRELDLLALVMGILSCWHAHRHGQWSLVIAGFLLGLITEHLSLRFGGTHCHASGLIDFMECSSFNSVAYYLSWVYSCVSLGRRLVDEKSWAFPLLCGMFFFGFCGSYELQGPLMGWWHWPDTQLLVKAGCTTIQFGVPAADSRGLVASQHAFEALSSRVHGVPVLAPYFHFAFGWGIAIALQLVRFRPTVGGTVFSVLAGPAIALVWDPPVRLLGTLFGATPAEAAPFLMLVSFLVPLLLGAPLRVDPRPADHLLLAIPLCNELYFVLHALVGRGAAVLPPSLKLLVLGVATVATAAYARAAGIVRPKAACASS